MAFQGRILTPKNEKQREIPQRYMVSLPWHLPYIITMVIWYHMVSHGITWYHMVSHGITWYHRVKSLWPHRCSSVFQWVIDPGPEDNNPSKLQEVIRGALDLRW